MPCALHPCAGLGRLHRPADDYGLGPFEVGHGVYKPIRGRFAVAIQKSDNVTASLRETAIAAKWDACAL